MPWLPRCMSAHINVKVSNYSNSWRRGRHVKGLYYIMLSIGAVFGGRPVMQARQLLSFDRSTVFDI